VAEGGDERTDGVVAPEVMEEFELVLDSAWRGGHVDLLDGDVARSAAGGRVGGGGGATALFDGG
jgi:hypothetical protein